MDHEVLKSLRRAAWGIQNPSMYWCKEFRRFRLPKEVMEGTYEKRAADQKALEEKMAAAPPVPSVMARFSLQD